jgi:hypothetical protein
MVGMVTLIMRMVLVGMMGGMNMGVVTSGVEGRSDALSQRPLNVRIAMLIA